MNDYDEVDDQIKRRNSEIPVNNEPQAEFKGILIHGTPVLPTTNQVDALARLISHIIQRIKKEGQNAK